jgi:hypothetical protein
LVQTPARPCLPSLGFAAPADFFAALLGECPSQAVWTTASGFRISGSSPLPDGYDEPKILLYSTQLFCLTGADAKQWRAEAAAIAATRRVIIWRSPSRHEIAEGGQPVPLEDEIFAEAASLEERLPAEAGTAVLRETIRGGRERGRSKGVVRRCDRSPSGRSRA